MADVETRVRRMDCYPLKEDGAVSLGGGFSAQFRAFHTFKIGANGWAIGWGANRGKMLALGRRI